MHLKPVNTFTVKLQLPMANIENELESLKRLKVFANFDISHSYWQLMRATKSQKC